MLHSNVIVGLVVALASAAIAFLGAQQLGASGWGRRALLVAAVLVPIAASAASLTAGIEESSRTRFCLSCHEMTQYGQSLFVDDRHALPAAHYQNRLVERDNACFSCHTDYALFGDFKAKLNGLRHVYVHYLGKIPEKMALYRPYPNYNCLHCHEDARRFIENPAHRAVSTQITSGELSCLKCHALGHDLGAVNDHHFWQAQ